jgi:penicillin amidase
MGTTSFSERLAAFPTTAPIQSIGHIHWNEYAVPFIEAESDKDGFFLLGAIHAHLRLGQMELLKRLASGRLSEMVGPFANDLDHTIRILHLGKGSQKVIEKMDPETKDLLSAFVAGINWYQNELQQLPPEFELFQMEREQWGVEDVLLMTRLAGIDLSWMFYFGFLQIEEQSLRERLWQHFLEGNEIRAQQDQLTMSLHDMGIESATQLFMQMSKTGSNAVVISGDRTKHGAALLASDPHLGTSVPNFWLLAGIRTPEFQVVGMMIPGVPFFALGRNEHIAWGGTNLRAISTHLYRVEPQEISSRKERIRTRWWFDTMREVRESSLGPIISDAPFFPENSDPIALYWVGHQGRSDEVTSFLRANRAQTFDEFLKSFESYGVSGQNMLYGDHEGNIGHLLAYHQPLLKDADRTMDLFKSAENIPSSFRSAPELPYRYNPNSGYIGSANDKSFDTEIPLSFSYADPSRALRMAELIEAQQVITRDHMKELQQDVHSLSSITLRDLLLSTLTSAEQKAFEEDYRVGKMYQAFSQWDGFFDTESTGALAFHLIISESIPEILQEFFPDEQERSMMLRGALWQKVLRQRVQSDVDKQTIARGITQALQNTHKQYARYGTWGAMHEHHIQHILGRLPIIGSRFRFEKFEAPGSSDTLYKSANTFSLEPHSVSYGAQARFIAELDEPDENYFVLLGGQDGWIRSENFLDQIPLWKAGEYMRLPLSAEGVRKSFRWTTEITSTKITTTKASSENLNKE